MAMIITQMGDEPLLRATDVQDSRGFAPRKDKFGNDLPDDFGMRRG